ncbi:EAL domain-containing protein [Thiomicrorhabdus sediminis]|uniref:EAL domain-containing protein n=1 Tax=Thiomicrorhabdus sediminis TaxID=2580412 RepID=A0A4P9K458_9GAMM|nr:EAL domain-containing protein [Thiomicrorhabdus sediminis]QCU89724.1 EAL domain-containing protein [Thiomicrorhabdus sediminis]
MNKRFVALFSIILLVTFLFIYDVYKNVTETYRSISTEVEQQQLKRKYLTAMYNASRERSLGLLQMLAEEDPFALDQYDRKISAYSLDFIIARQELFELPLSDAELKLLNEQREMSRTNQPLQDAVAKLLINKQREQALDLLKTRAIPSQTRILHKIDEIIELSSNQTQGLIDSVNQSLDRSQTRFAIIILIFLLLFLSVFVYAFYSSRKEKELLQSNLQMEQEIAQQLRSTKDKLSQYTNALSTFTVMLTPTGVIELVNNAAAESMGKNQDAWLGRYFHECNWWVSDSVRKEIASDVLACANGKTIDKEVEICSYAGEMLALRFILNPIRDSEGCIIYLVAEGQDITERKRVEKKISYHASHDALTGLINRYEFEHRLSLLLQRSEDHEYHYVFYMDLDQFKIVNDSCGHSAGDELIRQIPSIIKPSIRKSDILARLGGDEFGIIIENADLSIVQKIAEEIIEAISQYQFVCEGKAFRIGVSIGIVEVDETMVVPDLVMKWTDSACYVAKDKGRNSYHIYVSGDEKLISRQKEMDWISRIEMALQQGDFELYAQPIVEVVNGEDKAMNYELLVRMRSGNQVIPPGAFLPAAERYNRAMDVDYWVFSEALKVLSENSDFLEAIGYCSINISAQSLVSHEFLQFVLKRLDEVPDLAEKITIEVTETAAISNLTQARHFIAELRKVGVRFALDDFGSGLSSFGYLKNLRVDFLKIDGMFVKDIADDPIDYAMVKSIHEVGHVMGLKTIAEFVENKLVLQKLKKIGVNYAQGYGIGVPEPLSVFIDDARKLKQAKS